VDVAKTLINIRKRFWQPAVSCDGSDSRKHVEIADLVNLER
jgi:hypothetical protein